MWAQFCLWGCIEKGLLNNSFCPTSIPLHACPTFKVAYSYGMGGHTLEGKEMIFCFHSESMIYLFYLPSLNGQCIVLLLQTMLLICLFFLVFQFACESCYKVNSRKNHASWGGIVVHEVFTRDGKNQPL